MYNGWGRFTVQHKSSPETGDIKPVFFNHYDDCSCTEGTKQQIYTLHSKKSSVDLAPTDVIPTPFLGLCSSTLYKVKWALSIYTIKCWIINLFI